MSDVLAYFIVYNLINLTLVA